MKSERGMSYEEAVKVLGLKPGETVESYERAFEEVRKHMKRLRDEADTPEKRVNYELELTRFEEALQVAESHRPKKSKAGLSVAILLLLIGVIIAGVIFGPQFAQNQAKIREAEARLPEARKAAGARNWTEAEKIYKEILEVSPRSEEAQEGLKEVDVQRSVERRMQVRFALGKVQGLMDIRRWDDAEKAMEEVLTMDGEDEQLIAFKVRMKEERKADDIIRLGEEIELARREEQWQTYVDKTVELTRLNPDDERLPDFEIGLEEARLVLARRREEARELYERALALDTGEFSEEALNFLEQAQRLSPSNEATVLLSKMSSYVQTIKVPGEVKTIAEAVLKARTGDKVVIAEGVYKESVLVPAGVYLEGVKGKTILEARAEEGSVLMVKGRGTPARLTHLIVRHSGVYNGEKRFPVVLVRGAQAVLSECEVGFGAGHGIAVIAGGRCEISDCEVKGCGWDGVAVMGKGSEAILQDSRSVANFHHGLDVWDGGKVWVQRSRFQDNGLTGILLTSAGEECRVESSSIERNREVGIVASSGVSALIRGNLISENLLGGIFAEDEGTELSVISNNIKNNGEVGLAVAKEVLLTKELDNSTEENDGRDKWLNVDLSKIEPKNKILRALPVE